MKKRMNPLLGIPDLVHELDLRVDRHPGYADYRNLRALARAFTADLDGALADLQEALQKNPCYEAALLNLAWLYVERDEVERARGLLEDRAAQGLCSSRRGHLKMLDAYGRFGAQAGLEVIESYAPRSAPPSDEWLELGRLWLLSKEKRESELDEQMQRVLHWRPAAESHFHAVGVLTDAGIDAEGLKTWAETYRGNPHVAMILHECARICSREAGKPRGDELLHWCVTVSLDLCEYWLSIGWHHDLEGRDLEAENAFRHALAADPKGAQPHIHLGLLHAATGHPREAVTELERATDLQPRYADVRYMLGLLHQELGHLDDAEAAFRNALAIHPGYLMARLALGSLLESQGGLEEAVKMLEIVRAAGVSSVDLEERLARLYHALGSSDAAAEARARAAALSDEAADSPSE
jgi:tetratricopeptide (TPR) repeat protein